MEKKVVLITGASSGCGKETAKQLISQGYKVYAVSRRIEQMQDLQSLGAVCLKMDITINDDIKKVIERIKDDENKIDILINNAGYGQFGSIEDVSEIDARRQYDVNVFGVANMIKSSLHLLRNSKDARIVNVSSIAAKIPGPSAG
jgi:NADP-dependent 3-hydroxy acid dehydrogenase YdfG